MENAIYEEILSDYFQLQYNLNDLYTQWGNADPNFREVASTFTGVRMLRQDPTENVFSFICSSNNHISRISSMVEKMCVEYGQHIGELDGVAYHAFPTATVLAQDGVEQRLRELGFGYRAKFIQKSARIICERGDDWLFSLRGLPYEEAKAELMTLCGVGAKVSFVRVCRYRLLILVQISILHGCTISDFSLVLVFFTSTHLEIISEMSSPELVSRNFIIESDFQKKVKIVIFQTFSLNLT